MTIALTDTARVVAALLARRPTEQEELPTLMRTVHAALAQLAAEPQTEAPTDHRRLTEDTALRTPPPAPLRRRPRQTFVEEPQAEPAAPAPPPPPTLVRRADVITVAPVEHPPFDVPSGALRGVVKWFDTHTRRGALRLPGHAGDVPIEPQILAEMGIARLYKGQEIEATLSEEAAPRITRLALPGGTTPLMTTAGVVHSRRAKPVVVELKREALRRVAARAEAELLLRPERTR